MAEVPLIILIGVAPAFFGATVGGSGLISIPALVLVGLTPHQAVATDQLGLAGQTCAAWTKLHRARAIDYRLGVPVAMLTACGSFIGASILIAVPAAAVQRALGVMILLVAAVLVRRPDTGNVSRPTQLGNAVLDT